MKVALVNPAWRFENSIYFGCREPHLPLELGYSKALLERHGHQTLMLDGLLENRNAAELAEAVIAFGPEMVVVTTAPTYLFWRCAPPELRVPRDMIRRLRHLDAVLVAVGPHGSSTPAATLHKLGADVVLRGECEEAVQALADAQGAPATVPGAAWRDAEGGLHVNGPPRSARFTDAPPMIWPATWINRHRHHHHRFDIIPNIPAAEVEASRGCPYNCSFCAKIDFRDRYRRRDLGLLLAEIDQLISQGVGYLYFIDEIFLPQPSLLRALEDRDIKFGVQTRIDLWKPDMLALLGQAGCVSIEAGVESLTPEGRAALDKNCRMSTAELSARLVKARAVVPFVQANLIRSAGENLDMIADWRESLRMQGVWANDPVPLFPYPSSPDYLRLWGKPDGQAWERAHAYYLGQFDEWADIQDCRPLPLPTLEAIPC